MIKPIFRGVLVAIVIVSFLFFVLGFSGALHENVLTGSVVGVEKFTSYAFGIFLVGLVLFVLVLKFRKKKF